MTISLIVESHHEAITLPRDDHEEEEEEGEEEEELEDIEEQDLKLTGNNENKKYHKHLQAACMYCLLNSKLIKHIL